MPSVWCSSRSSSDSAKFASCGVDYSGIPRFGSEIRKNRCVKRCTDPNQWFSELDLERSFSTSILNLSFFVRLCVSGAKMILQSPSLPAEM